MTTTTIKENKTEQLDLTVHPYLELDDLLAQGYGINPKLVMRNYEISRNARFFYSYLSCFCGSGNCCYPSYETVLFECGFSERTYRKVRDELVAWGILSIKKKEIRKSLENGILPTPQARRIKSRNYPRNA